ncbi:MAG: hypothetical protein KA191_07040 [Verrucomicrobia bacterium]|jgi:hypothetical protein|nr:hypothetical protein [Verrucomicrobiota bacterium]OQC67907.1 MAG: hypothetical protein BWX48_00412 [Verrucomicrobia bacterium ADurb.Bin006]NMD20215.1 hypothetical protein [Verrucomicrobiota bacterium]HOA61143.1 hypothetical protein [Verrucomicrobiota bacterium]HOF48757.1 hypothetical protein [Verrucomicrobiota bacterium]
MGDPFSVALPIKDHPRQGHAQFLRLPSVEYGVCHVRGRGFTRTKTPRRFLQIKLHDAATQAEADLKLA